MSEYEIRRAIEHFNFPEPILDDNQAISRINLVAGYVIGASGGAVIYNVELLETVYQHLTAMESTMLTRETHQRHRVDTHVKPPIIQ